MNNFDPHRENLLKQRWQDHRRQITSSPSTSFSSLAFYVGNNNNNYNKKFKGFLGLEDDDLVSIVVPAGTIVLEGHSIYQHISLHSHDSYQSLVKALRQMFVNDDDDGDNTSDDDLDHSNAIPSHLIVYEDMENDLLLASDLSWKPLYN